MCGCFYDHYGEKHKANAIGLVHREKNGKWDVITGRGIFDLCPKCLKTVEYILTEKNDDKATEETI